MGEAVAYMDLERGATEKFVTFYGDRAAELGALQGSDRGEAVAEIFDVSVTADGVLEGEFDASQFSFQSGLN